MTNPCPDIREKDLQTIHLFRCVAYESIKGLLESCSIREIRAQEILIHAGKLNSTVYFVLKGRLRVHLKSLDSEPIAILEVGESVGEMSVIDNQPTSAFVVADEDSRLMVMDEDILWSLVQSSHAAACNLLFTLTKRVRQADAVICKDVELEKLYHRYGSVDALTGLHNRYWLNNALERIYKRCSVDKTPFSIIMIDIDEFKLFNDRFGHLYGDRILYSVAQTIIRHLRPSEIIARYGGDEFIILLPDMNLEQAKEVADRIHGAVSKAPPLIFDENEIPQAAISAGVAEMKLDQSLEILITDADAALYRAKHKGRNCVSL